MKLAIEDDRLAHLLMSGDDRGNYDDVRRRLDRAALVLRADASIALPWAQAALLTAAECGVRMFPGGVYLGSDFHETTLVGQFAKWPMRRYLELAGCRITVAPDHAITLHIGAACRRIGHGMLCWAEGWTAVASPDAPSEPLRAGNEIGGILAGALGIGEVFRSAVLGDILACRRTSRLSALSPGVGGADELELDCLPAAYWLLGLGNLGQALLWTVSLLPYADPGLVSLFLQDADVSEAGNLPVQLLTKPNWIGRRKARNAAAWADDRGFCTTIIENRFALGAKRSASEPGLALVGVDNLMTRRAAAGSNFDLVLDAGLGATSAEIFDIRLHGFPGMRSPEQAWPEPEPQIDMSLDRSLRDLVATGRIDQCGALTIAGRSLGIPSTAVAAAAIQVAQSCRAVTDGSFFDLADVSLLNCRRVTGHRQILARPGIIPFLTRRDE